MLLMDPSKSFGNPFGEIPQADRPELPSGCVPRMIGSRMWEFLTGTRYTTAQSDLDLVVDLSDAGSANQAGAFLSKLQTICSLRLDAEFSFPGRGEVHWREWLSEADPLLVKSFQEVALRPRQWFFENHE